MRCEGQAGTRTGRVAPRKLRARSTAPPVMKPCIGFAQASAGDVNHSTQLRQIVNGLAWVATKGVASRDRLWETHAIYDPEIPEWSLIHQSCRKALRCAARHANAGE